MAKSSRRGGEEGGEAEVDREEERRNKGEEREEMQERAERVSRRSRGKKGGGEAEGAGEERAAARRKERKAAELAGTWRPFEGADVLSSPRKDLRSGVKAPKKNEPEMVPNKIAAAKPPGASPKTPSVPERKARAPRQKREAVPETEEARRKREREERVTAIYKELKKSGKTYGDVLTYMREYRAYSRGARVEAAKKLLEDIEAGKITPEIILKAENGPSLKFVEVAIGHEKGLRGPTRERSKGPREGVFYKKGGKSVLLEPALVELDKLEEGTTEETIGEHGEKGAKYHEGARWSWDEWYNFLLRQYAARPELAKKKIEDYFKKHKEEHKGYSTEAFEAHERLFDELLAEKEGRELGEIFKAREEGVGKGKISERDIDEITLHFREYLQNLPTPEGKAILERLREVQMGEFESMLGENIRLEDIDNKIIEKKAAEIPAEEKISLEEAKTRATELVEARAKARTEVAGAEEKLESLKIKSKKPGAKEEAAAIEKLETDYKKKKEELEILDVALEEAGVAAENELITEAAKKFFALQELIVHHRGGWDPKRGFCMGSYSDLDGQGAVAFWRKAGIDVKKGSYLPPGYRRQGAFNVDTGLADGLFSEREEIDMETGEKKVVNTWYEDHHGIYSDRATSATKYMFEVFTKLGLLKFESEEEKRAWEKAVEFVTQDDNFTFPGVKSGEFYKVSGEKSVDGKTIYETSDRRFVGYAHGMPFNDVLQFFIDQEKKPENLRKTPVDELSDKELGDYGISQKRVVKRGEKVKEDLKTVEKLIKDGWVVTTKSGKKLVVDIGDKMGRDGQWAAGSRGLDGILRYNPENHSFTVALNEGTFDEPTQELLKSLPQGILIRSNFFYKPPAEKVEIGHEEDMSERTKKMLERVKGELLVTLDELIGGVVDPKKKNELGRDIKEFLDKERERGKLIRAHIFRRQEVDLPAFGGGKQARPEIILAHWRASTPDGTPIRVEGIPDNFVSGEKGLIRLKNKKSVILEGRDIELAGFEWNGNRDERQEVDVWIGEWQKTDFPEPTPEEIKIEDAKRKVAESIGEEIEDLRKKLYRDPNYADVSWRVVEDYLKKVGEELWQKLVKTPSK
jgi:hypothetical protein